MKNSLSKKQKKNMTRILISLVAFLIVVITDKIVDLAKVTDSNFGWLLPFCLYFAIYAVIGYDVLFKAVRNILHGQLFDGHCDVGRICSGNIYRSVRQGHRGL